MSDAKHDVESLFEAALERRSVAYKVAGGSLYEVQVGETSLTVSLDNVRRNYERDGDAGAVERFADMVCGGGFGPQLPWEEAREHLRYALEPSDYAVELEDVLHEPVTDGLVKVFVVASPDGARLSWVSDGMMEGWGVGREEVVKQASANMDGLVRGTRLEVQDIDGVKLGMLALKDTHFKASLLLSPAFRELVEPVHGWPVFAVAPARDFVYVLSHKERGFLGRLGHVVLREYNGSGHPITADVLGVDDSGVTAIGSFAPREA